MDIVMLQKDEPKPAPTSAAPAPSAPQMPPQSIPAMKLYPSLKTQSPPQSQAGPSSAPPSTKSSEEMALDAKVAEAIDQMRAMGFHDDGELWCSTHYCYSILSPLVFSILNLISILTIFLYFAIGLYWTGNLAQNKLWLPTLSCIPDVWMLADKTTL